MLFFCFIITFVLAALLAVFLAFLLAFFLVATLTFALLLRRLCVHGEAEKGGSCDEHHFLHNLNVLGVKLELRCQDAWQR